MFGGYGFSHSPSNFFTPHFEFTPHGKFSSPLTSAPSPKSAFEDLSKLNEFKKVVENVYAIQSLPVEEGIKREEIDNYLERKIKEFEGILETYGIKAYDAREKYFALSYLGAVVEDDLSLGCYSKERVGKEVNEVLEMERASEELVRRGLYEYKNGELVRTPDYRKKRKQYPRKEIRKLERKAGVKNRRWFAVAATLTMLGAVGLAGCVTDKVPQIFKPQNPKDGDVLPDEWEMKYFGNLKQFPDRDPDHDYVDNYFEGNMVQTLLRHILTMVLTISTFSTLIRIISQMYQTEISHRRKLTSFYKKYQMLNLDTGQIPMDHIAEFIKMENILKFQ